MFLNCIAVGAGGFLGAVSRYLMGMIPFLQKGSLPYHTLLINVLGAILIGIVVKTADSTEILNPSTVLFLKVGIWRWIHDIFHFFSGVAGSFCKAAGQRPLQYMR